jgi:hypothetical protein
MSTSVTKSVTTRRAAIVAAAALFVLFAIEATAPSPTAALCSIPVGDFNGDGHADAAFGEPTGDPYGYQNAGGVHVLYGTASGLSTYPDAWFIHQGTVGVPDSLATADVFGYALATGDFNDDCYSDLAISAPSDKGFGSVTVMYGSSDGIQVLGPTPQIVYAWQVEPTNEEYSGFGQRLASADFDGDGYADLAVGAPAYDGDSGGVGVLYGGASGLDLDNPGWFTQNTVGVPDSNEDYDRFGQGLAAGDLTGDGRAELVVGAPGESVGAITKAGAITVLPGTATGVTTTGSKAWNQDSTGVPANAETGDSFGYAIGVGDITGDGKADVVVGSPFEDIGAVTNAGIATYFKGSTNLLLSESGITNLHLDTTGVPGSPIANDQLGSAISVADYTGDLHAEAAVAARNRTVASAAGAGAVLVLPGSGTGLTGTGSKVLSQDSAGIVGGAEAADWFAASLLSLKVTSSARFDLLVGVPLEDRADKANAGSAHLLRGSAAGLTGTGSQLIATTSLLPGLEAGAEFGYSIG